MTQANKSFHQINGAIKNSILQLASTNRRKLIEDNASAIRAEYGDWVSDDEVEAIVNAKNHNAICAKCTGFPCKHTKIFEQRFVKVIEPLEKKEEVIIKSAPCKFEVQARKQKKAQNNFKRSRIPLKYVGKTFDDYEVTSENAQAVHWAKWLLKNPTRSLYLYGVAGCGKTFLASIVAQEFFKEGYSVVFGDVPSLLDDIKATFEKCSTVEDNLGYEKSAYESIITELENVDLLVLDDIGAEYASQWAMERLYSIVNNRYNAQKAILATSNFDAKGLEEHYKGDFRSQRIISRFMEMGKLILVGLEDKRTFRR